MLHLLLLVLQLRAGVPGSGYRARRLQHGQGIGGPLARALTMEENICSYSVGTRPVAMHGTAVDAIVIFIADVVLHVIAPSKCIQLTCQKHLWTSHNVCTFNYREWLYHEIAMF